MARLQPQSRFIPVQICRFRLVIGFAGSKASKAAAEHLPGGYTRIYVWGDLGVRQIGGYGGHDGGEDGRRLSGWHTHRPKAHKFIVLKHLRARLLVLLLYLNAKLPVVTM